MSDREKFNAWVDPQWPRLSIEEDNRMFACWQASRRAALSEAPTPSAIEATAALIANGLVGQASEEDVREVERLINELLGRGV